MTKFTSLGCEPVNLLVWRPAHGLVVIRGTFLALEAGGLIF